MSFKAKDRQGNIRKLIEYDDVFPQIFSGRNNTAKLSVKANNIIPLVGFGNFASKLFQISADGCIEVITDDISGIELIASIQINSGTEIYKIAGIERIRNSEKDAIAVAAAYGTNFNIVIPTTYVRCQKGDKFYIFVTTDSVVNLATGGGYRTFLTVRKIC